MQLGKYHEFDPLTFEESIPSKILSWVIMIRYLYRMNVLKWRKIPISKHCLLRNVSPNHGTLNFTGRSYVKLIMHIIMKMIIQSWITMNINKCELKSNWFLYNFYIMRLQFCIIITKYEISKIFELKKFLDKNWPIQRNIARGKIIMTWKRSNTSGSRSYLIENEIVTRGQNFVLNQRIMCHMA